jgi:hypothetical protein
MTAVHQDAAAAVGVSTRDRDRRFRRAPCQLGRTYAMSGDKAKAKYAKLNSGRRNLGERLQAISGQSLPVFRVCRMSLSSVPILPYLD